MKNSILKALFVFASFTQILNAQSDISMNISFPDEDLYRILQYQNIDYYKVTFKGGELKGMNYSIIAKDIWNGKIQKTDTIVNSKTSDYIDNIAADSLALFVIANRTEPENLKIKFSFKGLSMIKNYRCKDTDTYSLRPYGTQVPIEPGKPFYAFAYILPYEKNGFQYYCAVEYSGKDIEKWYEEFGIEHYVLFEMKFY